MKSQTIDVKGKKKISVITFQVFFLFYFFFLFTHRFFRNVEVLDEKKMVFPAIDAAASIAVTNYKNLYEDEKQKVDGTTFTHRRMAVRPQLATNMHTMGGQVNYQHKPTGTGKKF